MLLATGEAFPLWLVWSSAGLAIGAASLFAFGARRSRVKSAVADVPFVPPPTPGTLVPPPPLVPLAAMPPAGANSQAERRVGFRRVGNPVEVLVCDQNFLTPPRRGWVVDRSRHGLRLSLIENVANGTILQVRPAGAPESQSWLAVETRNAQPGEDCWELGCKFLTEPSWEVLLMFG